MIEWDCSPRSRVTSRENDKTSHRQDIIKLSFDRVLMKMDPLKCSVSLLKGRFMICRSTVVIKPVSFQKIII